MRSTSRACVLALLASGLSATAVAQGKPASAPIVVGSKSFTESRILAEIIAQLIEAKTDIPVERKLGLSGTMIALGALESGDIDIYPEYTGTAWAAILKEETKVTDPLRAFLHVQRRFRNERAIEWLEPFGFNNTYAIAMREALAEKLGVRRVSDLKAHPTLRFGVTHEFLNRSDGYPGLAKAYGFSFEDVRGMEHGLAYEAIKSDEIDVVDAYSTDGKLLRYPLRLLRDDEQFFPPYHAAPLIRADALERHPELRGLLSQLAFRIPDERMQKLNFEVEGDGRSFHDVAKGFLVAEELLAPSKAPAQPEARRAQTFWSLMKDRAGVTVELAIEHVILAATSVLLAALFAIPLGILISRRERLKQIALGGAGVIQTIPSLALLAFMIPIPGLGLGPNAAIAALFLYAILPILRNTYTGIIEVDPKLVEAARGLGLTDRQILVNVELPLSIRTIMAGLRTSTVISIGVATLAAFIGAGGLGEPILTGLQLNDTNMILTGAVPAAGLAVLVDFILARVESWVVPKGIS